MFMETTSVPVSVEDDLLSCKERVNYRSLQDPPPVLRTGEKEGLEGVDLVDPEVTVHSAFV